MTRKVIRTGDSCSKTTVVTNANRDHSVATMLEHRLEIAVAGPFNVHFRTEGAHAGYLPVSLTFDGEQSQTEIWFWHGTEPGNEQFDPHTWVHWDWGELMLDPTLHDKVSEALEPGWPDIIHAMLDELEWEVDESNAEDDDSDG